MINKKDRNFSSFKAPHSGPKAETIILNNRYAISINPNEEWTPTSHPMTWVKKTVAKLQDALSGCTLELYPEFSPTGRMHYHGVIDIKDHVEYFRFLNLLKLNSTYNIKELFISNSETTDKETRKEALDKWLAYCTKQAHIFMPLFKNSILSYPISVNPAVRLNTVQKEKYETNDKVGHFHQ